MKVYNFSPGPAKLDSSIISKSQEAMYNFQNTGLSILEIGHRSKEFEKLMNSLQENIRNIFNVPTNYFTLFLQGGATFQNTFIANNFDKRDKDLGCLVTGTWGKNTFDDFSKIRETKLIELSQDEIENFVESGEDLKNVDYLHLTSNETINGVQLREFNKINQRQTLSGTKLKDYFQRINNSMHISISREIERLEKGMSFLGSIGSVAPFVGLLGTVWGIVNAFQSIAISNNTSLAVVAPGIAEALFATALGLLAAIPAVVAYNKFNSDSQKYFSRIENFSKRFLSII